MREHLSARPPLDADEERLFRTLAHVADAPADRSFHVEMIARSWGRLRVRQSADELECHLQTVRDRLHAFAARLRHVRVRRLGRPALRETRAVAHPGRARRHPGPGPPDPHWSSGHHAS